jgi:mRNA interferase MazF
MGINQYDFVLVGLDPTKGAEMKKPRPCIVISPDEMNDSLRTIQIAPLTTNTRRYPWRVPSAFQGKKGMIALDQIRSIDKGRVLKRLGKARSPIVRDVKTVIDEMLVQ